MSHKNPIVAGVTRLNIASGNTTTEFNKHQLAMYTGLQCEELGEKMDALGFKMIANELLALSHALRAGTYDYVFTGNYAQLVQILDADCDLIVVSIGSMISYGADVDGALNEVNTSNCSKIHPDGTIHKDAGGKWIKPDTYVLPKLEKYLLAKKKTPLSPQQEAHEDLVRKVERLVITNGVATPAWDEVRQSLKMSDPFVPTKLV